MYSKKLFAARDASLYAKLILEQEEQEGIYLQLGLGYLDYLAILCVKERILGINAIPGPGYHSLIEFLGLRHLVPGADSMPSFFMRLSGDLHTKLSHIFLLGNRTELLFTFEVELPLASLIPFLSHSLLLA